MICIRGYRDFNRSSSKNAPPFLYKLRVELVFDELDKLDNILL